MSKRIFVTVKRGPMDATAVCVFPWEMQILQHIHGSDVKEVSIDELCSMDGALKVEKLKAKREGAKLDAPDMRQQLEIMVYVDPDSDPAEDPAGEYNRLSMLYGMDADLPMTNVARLFGEFHSGGFEKLLAGFAKQRAPKPRIVQAREEGLDNAPEKLSVAELRDALDVRSVKWAPVDNKAVLVKKLEEALVA